MKKKQKNVPPVTEEKPEQSEPEPEPVEYNEPEVVVQQPKPLTVEERFERLEMAINEDRQVLSKLLPLADAVERAQQAAQANQQNPQPKPQGMGDIGAVLQLISQFTGSGSTDSEMAQLGKEALKSQIGMANAITNAVVSKIVGKATSDVAAAVVGE